MAVAPHLVLPVRDPAVASKRRLGVHHHGGTIRFPAEFFVSHPLQTDRAAGHCPRQQRGVGRNVVGAVVTVAAGTLHMHAADRGGRHFQDFDQFGAQRKDALRVRPYRHAPILELGDRAGWTDRAVRHVRLGVDRLEGTGIGGCRTLLDADGGILARQRLDHLEDARGIRQLGSQCPLRALAQRFARLDRLFFALGHDTEEGAVPHHRNHARASPWRPLRRRCRASSHSAADGSPGHATSPRGAYPAHTPGRRSPWPECRNAQWIFPRSCGSRAASVSPWPLLPD